MEKFCLEKYLSKGVERIIKEILKVSVTSPRKSAFFVRYISTAKRAGTLRAQAEKEGEHIPPFLIASITEECNLKCHGCYAHANHACQDKADKRELPANKWGDIFFQAEELGISFILLAGGEPLTRRDILAEASLHKRILFPVFTNGTLIQDKVIELFANAHNLLPVISLEGLEEWTDKRRGAGTYRKVEEVMKKLQSRKILFGTSITASKENLEHVISEKFIHKLKHYGCKAMVYVEYVPFDEKTKDLAFGEEERERMSACLSNLRKQEEEILFISFPGDEKESGGCLAAGRGFFHINALGSAEPCPFSPYSDTNLVHTDLKAALQSPLFLKLRNGTILSQEHSGGCVLFEQEEKVKECLIGEKR